MNNLLELTRLQILAFRRRTQALDQRLRGGKRSLHRAAWAGLQDSMPRAALLSIHARMQGIGPTVLEASSLVQVWGPRFNAYVIAAPDVAVFTLGRLPVQPGARRRAVETAARLQAALGDERVAHAEAARRIGLRDPNALRYATTTGTVLIHWDGARQPTVWCVPAPEVDPRDAQVELARRYLHVFGPASAASFARWAGVRPVQASATFETLAASLIPVRTPVGDAWLLAQDYSVMRAPPAPPARARLLPSGDTYYLLQGRDRELLLDDAQQRATLWTSRVWPGAVLVDGEIVGCWRRAQHVVTVEPWRRLPGAAREAVAAEALALPLPGIDEVVVRWQ